MILGLYNFVIMYIIYTIRIIIFKKQKLISLWHLHNSVNHLTAEAHIIRKIK